MTNDTIQVPRKRFLEGRLFPKNDFKRTDEALKELESAKDPEYEAQFMPEIIDTRIESPADSPIWQTWITAPSIRATGKTKQGNAVVVYAHIPNHFSKADNITKAINQGLVNGAGRLPQNEFQRILDLEDNERVFVIDYETLKRSTSDVISLSKALKHPQMIPFISGKEKAEKHLDEHKKIYGERIGVWHSDDLSDEPLARVLHVGFYDGGLGGGGYLDGDVHFLGVSFAGEACVRKIFLTERKLTDMINEYVAPVNQREVKERVSALFR